MPAVAIPLLPDQVDAWRAWARELVGTRREQFDDFNRRLGLTGHRVWYVEGPGGPMALVVHDGPGADRFMERLAASDRPFDVWFRDSISRFHGVDFSGPHPGAPEQVLDWPGA